MRSSASVVVALCVAASLGAQDRAARWRADIAFLHQELPKRHKNLFHDLAREDFDAAIAKLDARVGDLTDAEVVVELVRIVARARDAHTAVAWQSAGFKMAPIILYEFKDGVFVVAAAKSHTGLVGRRVTGIGGKPIAAVRKKIAELVPAENDAWLRYQVPTHMLCGEMIAACGFSESADSYDIQLAQPGGATETVTLKTVPLARWQRLAFKSPDGKTPLWRRKRQLPFWNDWLPDSKTLYFKYDKCRDAPGFQKLVRGTFGFLALHPECERFVLDLRSNSGGNSMVFMPLLGRILTSKLNETGKLFVIIGRRTFSSGVFAATDMRKTKAIFFGEPTGGKPNSYGEVRAFRLPNSKLLVKYSTKLFRRSKNGDPPSVMPDVLIEPDSKSFFAGRDPVLEAILRYKPKAEVGK